MSATHLLVAYGLCFGLMQDKATPITNTLKGLPWLGTFFATQLECAFCTGFHCGWMVYLLEAARSGFGPVWYVDVTLFMFASATGCVLLDTGIDGVLWLTSKQGS